MAVAASVLVLPVLAGMGAAAGAGEDQAPYRAVSVYRWAADGAPCPLPWTLLAAVGDLASDHGRVGGSTFDASGVAVPAIHGASLDGQGGRRLVPDTDGGGLDADPEQDRAVGPFQFLPATWVLVGVDGDGDGRADPQNLWDAATAAAGVLCHEGAGDPRTSDAAITAYFGSSTVTADVRRREAAIAAAVTSAEPRPGSRDHVGSLVTDDVGVVLEHRSSDGVPTGRAPAGAAGDVVVVGDWDGDGFDAPAAFRVDAHGFGQVTFFGGEGVEPSVAALGQAGDVPVAGDWDGDGIDDVGVFRSDHAGTGTFVLFDPTGERTVTFGQAGDVPLAGDWDGDGVDSVGVHRPGPAGEFRLADRTGNAYGRRIAAAGGLTPLVGDWDGDGVDTPAAVRTQSADDGTPQTTLEIFDRWGATSGATPIPPTPSPAAGVWPPPHPAPGLLTPVEAEPVGEVTAADGSVITLWRVGGITVAEPIVGSVAQLLAAARADGIVLQGWGWRSHEQQIALRHRHCADPWTTPAGRCNPPTATPGTSQHEYGLAIDFHTGGRALTADSPEFRWLAEHAPGHGLFNLASEPWHWSTTGR